MGKTTMAAAIGMLGARAGLRPTRRSCWWWYIPQHDDTVSHLLHLGKPVRGCAYQQRGSRSWRRSWWQPHGGVMEPCTSRLRAALCSRGWTTWPVVRARRAPQARHGLPLRCPAIAPKTTLVTDEGT